MIKFDLMKGNPKLDIQTLNFIWDELWRRNYLNKRKNSEQRAIYNFIENQINWLEELANKEVENK